MPKKKAAEKRRRKTSLVQIGSQPEEKLMSIREFFEQMAQQESEMIREARKRLENGTIPQETDH